MTKTDETKKKRADTIEALLIGPANFIGLEGGRYLFPESPIFSDYYSAMNYTTAFAIGHVLPKYYFQRRAGLENNSTLRILELAGLYTASLLHIYLHH